MGDWQPGPANLADGLRLTELPADIAAEQWYVGILLHGKPETLAESLPLLTADEFTWAGHRRIYVAVSRLYRSGCPAIDAIAVTEALRATGELEQVGGPAYLFTLLESAWPNDRETARYYAEKVREKARLRAYWDLRDALSGQLERCDDAEELRQWLSRELLRTAPEIREAVTLQTALDAEVRRIESGAVVPTLKFGLPAIDRCSGGLEAGEVGLMCGQPGTGKTVLAVMQALHAAETWGPVALISLEMGEARVARRVLGMGTGFTFGELREARYRDGQAFGEGALQQVNDAYAAAYQAAAAIYLDTESYRLEALVTRLRGWKFQHKIACVILDYGQLVKAEMGRQATRTDELGYVARALKNEVAVPLGVPVWCLAQPNRDVKQRGKGALLQMGDIYGASEWEAVANQIWFLNRDPAFPAAPSGEPETMAPVLLEIAKSRDGARAKIPLYLQGERFRFVARETNARHEPPEGERRCP